MYNLLSFRFSESSKTNYMGNVWLALWVYARSCILFNTLIAMARRKERIQQRAYKRQWKNDYRLKTTRMSWETCPENRWPWTRFVPTSIIFIPTKLRRLAFRRMMIKDLSARMVSIHTPMDTIDSIVADDMYNCKYAL